MTLSIMAFSIMTLSIRLCKTQHSASHLMLMLSVTIRTIILNVIMLNVVAPTKHWVGKMAFGQAAFDRKTQNV